MRHNNASLTQVLALLCSLSAQPASAETVAVPPMYIGPPYTAHDEPYTGNHVANSVSESIDALWAAYKEYWGVYPFGSRVCTHGREYYTDGLVTGRIAGFYFTGDCSGGNYVTAPPVCPAAYTLESDNQCHAEQDAAIPEKSLSQPEQCPVGNPIAIGTGNKYQLEVDRAPTIDGGLRFQRYYNSLDTETEAQGMIAFGANWRHTYSSKVLSNKNADVWAAIVIRDDGKRFFFTYNVVSGAWESDSDVRLTLTDLSAGGEHSGWQLRAEDGAYEQYDASGRIIFVVGVQGIHTSFSYGKWNRLLAVSNDLGESLTFEYDADSHIIRVVDNANRRWSYEYDSAGNLITVRQPDATADESDNLTVVYHYEDARFPNALTGITDERGIRFATYAYDEIGRAILSTHARSAGQVEVSYTESTRNIIDSRGRTRTFGLVVLNGVPLTTSVSGTGCAGCGGL